MMRLRWFPAEASLWLPVSSQKEVHRSGEHRGSFNDLRQIFNAKRRIAGGLEFAFADSPGRCESSVFRPTSPLSAQHRSRGRGHPGFAIAALLGQSRCQRDSEWRPFGCAVMPDFCAINLRRIANVGTFGLRTYQEENIFLDFSYQYHVEG
jgi:hypothetical protein